MSDAPEPPDAAAEPAAAGYEELILEHARSPRCLGMLPEPHAAHTLVNTLCGDEITWHVALTPAAALRARFTSRGCALCRASASVLAEAVDNGTVAAAAALLATFCAGFEAGTLTPSSPPLAALASARRYATRTRCVLLPWQALRVLVAGVIPVGPPWEDDHGPPNP